MSMLLRQADILALPFANPLYNATLRDVAGKPCARLVRGPWQPWLLHAERADHQHRARQTAYRLAQRRRLRRRGRAARHHRPGRAAQRPWDASGRRQGTGTKEAADVLRDRLPAALSHPGFRQTAGGAGKGPEDCLAIFRAARGRRGTRAAAATSGHGFTPDSAARLDSASRSNRDVPRAYDRRPAFSRPACRPAALGLRQACRAARSAEARRAPVSLAVGDPRGNGAGLRHRGHRRPRPSVRRISADPRDGRVARGGQRLAAAALRPARYRDRSRPAHPAAQRHARGPVPGALHRHARTEERRAARDPAAQPVLPMLRGGDPGRRAPSRSSCRRTAETGFLPAFDRLPKAVLERTVAAYICSPSNPEGAVADADYWRTLFGLADAHDFTVFADECYADIYLDQPAARCADGALCRDRRLRPAAHLPFAVQALGPAGPAVGHRGRRSRADGALQGLAQLCRPAGCRCRSSSPRPRRGATRPMSRPTGPPMPRNSGSPSASSAIGPASACRTAGFFLWLDVGNGEEAALKLWRDGGIRVLPGAYMGRESRARKNPVKPWFSLYPGGAR